MNGLLMLHIKPKDLLYNFFIFAIYTTSIPSPWYTIYYSNFIGNLLAVLKYLGKIYVNFISFRLKLWKRQEGEIHVHHFVRNCIFMFNIFCYHDTIFFNIFFINNDLLLFVYCKIRHIWKSSVFFWVKIYRKLKRTSSICRNVYLIYR